jgi:hypothetical protein
MTPMRANIVGPPDVTTRIKASIAACHTAASVLGLGKFRDVFAGILERDELAAAGQRDRFFKPPFPTAISHSRGAGIVPSPSPVGYQRPFGRTLDRRTAAQGRTGEYGPATDPR